MKSPDRYLWPVLLFTLVSRLPFFSKIPYGLDSVQFVLAMDHFDVRLHQPHPPGYFLFVMLGRLFRLVFQDSNMSLIALNIVASILTVWVIYLLGKNIFDPNIGLMAAILLSTSPTFWFQNEVALSYTLDCLFVCAVAYFCWMNLKGPSTYCYLAAFFLGISGGIRQNTIAFLLPLWLFSIYPANWKKRFLSSVVLGICISLWYFPMTWLSGGIKEYHQALQDHWINVIWRGIHWKWVLGNVQIVYRFIVLGLGPGLFLILFAGALPLIRRRWRILLLTPRILFIALWIIPALVFFVFIHSHSFQTGFSLIYLPALVLLVAASIHRVSAFLANPRNNEESQSQRGLPGTVKRYSRFSYLFMTFVCSFNVIVFLGTNVEVSNQEIWNYEKEVSEVTNLIRSSCDPHNTILVNYDYMQLGYRDFAFHLPEYYTISAFPTPHAGEPLITAASERKTLLLRQVPIQPSQKHFLIPLTLMNYLSSQSKQINPGFKILQTESGIKLCLGNIEELPKLLPQTRFCFCGNRNP
jgi:hypothetical protein